MNINNSYHVVVEANDKPITLNLREVWNYRDLIGLFTKRNFNLIYKQTILGPLWVILAPLMTSIVYTIVFGNMAGLSTAGVPKLLFYLCSNALWTFFADCLRKNSQTFIMNARVFGKVYFPRLTIPIATMMFAGIQFCIQLALTMVLIIYYLILGEVSISWQLFPLLIPVLLITGLIGLSMGILISSITTKYRDLQFLVGFGVQLWMYISPVIYPVKQISDGIWYKLLILNPMTAPMETFRLILLGTGTIEPISVLSTILFAAILVPVSIIIFNRVEKNFIDTV